MSNYNTTSNSIIGTSISSTGYLGTYTYPTYPSITTATWDFTNNACCMCHKHFSTSLNVNAIFLGGFWYCSDDCRLQFLLVKLIGTASID